MCADSWYRTASAAVAGEQQFVSALQPPSPSGNTKSTIVEYTLKGKVVGSWSVVGKVDGLGSDPQRHFVIATVNGGQAFAAWREVCPKRQPCQSKVFGECDLAAL